MLKGKQLNLIAVPVGAALLAHLLILLSTSLILQTLATLTLTAFIPGFLIVQLLLQSSISLPERILYSIAAGYAVLVVGMLLLSYLPGGISQWQVLLFFDLVIVVLLGGVLFVDRDAVTRQARQPVLPLLIAGLLLLLIAGSLRLTNIGYAEFHNDEARAALRAAAVIQGSEDVLFIHKKGPTEILIPTAVYALAGNFNEAAGRLPFAIANLTALFGVWLLGWRLFGPGNVGHIAGFIAALFLSLDGYFIGFSRIVQYQSVVFMTSVLTVAVFAKLWQDPRNPMGHMILAALFMVLGLLSHYEAGLAMLPVFVLLAGILLGAKENRVSQRYTEEAQRSTEKNESVREPKQHPLAQQVDELVHARDISARTAGRTTHYVRAIIVASLLGSVLLALFYVPYLTHPQFSATYTYLTERRLGGTGMPYNNLADVFLRTTVYSTTYYVALLALVTLLGLAVALRRASNQQRKRENSPSPYQGEARRGSNGLSQLASRIVIQLLSVALILFVVNSTWLTFGERDWAVLPFLLAFGIAWFLPRMSLGERTLWIWFGGLFLLAIFGTLKPRTHVYVFFIPWALLVGWILAQLWERLNRSAGVEAIDETRASVITKNPALKGRATINLLISISFLSIMVFLFGNYAYRYFVQNQPEVLRTWEENRPAGYWTAYDEPDKRALFGFPSSNGWKVVGQLYAQGQIEGYFETNELEAWGPAWYTRGQVRCKHDADWYFQTVSNLEPFYEFQEVAMNDFLSKGFAPWGQVTVNGVHKMTIHKRGGSGEDEAAEPLPIFELNDYLTDFERNTAPDLALTYPVINPPIPNPLHINLGNLFWLEGYDIEHPNPLRAGDTIRLTLFWRGQQPTDKTYKIFNQSFYGEGTMVAQKDGHPVCGNRDTWQWDPGELITDVHEIPVSEDAPDGLYPFITGMYELDSGVRLEVIGEDGKVLGNQVHLTDIRIGLE